MTTVMPVIPLLNGVVRDFFAPGDALEGGRPVESSQKAFLELKPDQGISASNHSPRIVYSPDIRHQLAAGVPSKCLAARLRGLFARRLSSGGRRPPVRC
jgi:hypothetical protein